MRGLFLLIFSIPHILGMEVAKEQGLIIPDIIKGHSSFFRMLAKQGPSDFNNNQLKFPDGTVIYQADINNLSLMYNPHFTFNDVTNDELVSLANYHSFFGMDSVEQLENILYERLKKQELTVTNLQKLVPDWQYFLGHRLMECEVDLLIKCKQLGVQPLKTYSIDKASMDHCERFSIEQELLGTVLLYKILRDQDAIMLLGKEETKIYNNEMSDELKKMLMKIKPILAYEKNMSLFAILMRFAYVSGMRCKLFLYNYRELISCLGAISLSVAYNRYCPVDSSISMIDIVSRRPYGLLGVLDYMTLMAFHKIGIIPR